LIGPEDERVFIPLRRKDHAYGHGSGSMLAYRQLWSVETFADVLRRACKRDDMRVSCPRESLDPETASRHIQPFLHAFHLTHQPRTSFWQQCLCLRNTFLPPTSPWIWEEGRERKEGRRGCARMPRENEADTTRHHVAGRDNQPPHFCSETSLAINNAEYWKIPLSSRNYAYDSRMIAPFRCKVVMLQTMRNGFQLLQV
jgi:hypothetical protein